MDMLEMDAVNSSVEEPVTAPVQNLSYDKPKNPLTGLVVALGVLVIVLIAGAGYLFVQNQKLVTSSTTPTPAPSVQTSAVASADPTAGWQTYTNEKEGFQFQYPVDYAISTVGEGINLQKDPKRALLYISLSANKSNLDPRDYLNKLVKEDPASKDILTSSDASDVQVGMYDALKLTKKVSENGYQDFAIYINHNNKLYILSFGPKSTEVNLANQILSTFKFTNQESQLQSKCIELMGNNSAWVENSASCIDVAGKNIELQKYCEQYNGSYVDAASAECAFNKQ